jgi:hypothetical protein
MDFEEIKPSLNRSSDLLKMDKSTLRCKSKKSRKSKSRNPKKNPLKKRLRTISKIESENRTLMSKYQLSNSYRRVGNDLKLSESSLSKKEFEPNLFKTMDQHHNLGMSQNKKAFMTLNERTKPRNRTKSFRGQFDKEDKLIFNGEKSENLHDTRVKST